MSEERRVICEGIYVEGDSICFDLSLYFSSPNAIPAGVFADSLVGMSRMTKESIGAIGAIIRLIGVDTIDAHEVYINTVRNGSKWSDFYFRVFLGSNREANKTADLLHARFGINKMLESRHFQNIMIAAIIAYSVR